MLSLCLFLVEVLLQVPGVLAWVAAFRHAQLRFYRLLPYHESEWAREPQARS